MNYEVNQSSTNKDGVREIHDIELHSMNITDSTYSSGGYIGIRSYGGAEQPTPRDTQFAGFAKLLWERLCDANGHGYIDVNKFDDDGVDPTNYQLVIAQSVYDLIYQGCEVIYDRETDFEARITLESMIEHFPDMTEWPEKTK